MYDDFYDNNDNYTGISQEAMYGANKQALTHILDHLKAKYDSEVLNRNALNTRKNNLWTQRVIAFFSFLLSFLFLIWTIVRAHKGDDFFEGVTFFIQAFLVMFLVCFCFRYFVCVDITYRIFMEKKPLLKYTMSRGIQTYRNMYNYYSDNIIELEKKMKPYKSILKKLEKGEELNEKELGLIDDIDNYKSITVKPCPYREEKVRLSSIFSYLAG